MSVLVAIAKCEISWINILPIDLTRINLLKMMKVVLIISKKAVRFLNQAFAKLCAVDLIILSILMNLSLTTRSTVYCL